MWCKNHSVYTCTYVYRCLETLRITITEYNKKKKNKSHTYLGLSSWTLSATHLFFSSQFFPSLSFPSAVYGDQRARNNRTCWQFISPEKILGGGSVVIRVRERQRGRGRELVGTRHKMSVIWRDKQSLSFFCARRYRTPVKRTQNRWRERKKNINTFRSTAWISPVILVFKKKYIIV